MLARTRSDSRVKAPLPIRDDPPVLHAAGFSALLFGVGSFQGFRLSISSL